MKKFLLFLGLIILFSACNKTDIVEYNSDFIRTWNGSDENNNYYIKIESNGQGRWEKNGTFSTQYSTGKTYEKKGNLKIGPKKFIINSEPAFIPATVSSVLGDHYEMTIDGIDYTGF